MSRLPGWRRARLGLGRTFQTARMFAEMNVLENLVVATEAARRNHVCRSGRLFGISPSPEALAEAASLLKEIRLSGHAGLLAGQLAHGDRKRLELALAVAVRRRLLLLDEPTAGMSPGDRLASVAMSGRLKRGHGLSLPADRA